MSWVAVAVTGYTLVSGALQADGEQQMGRVRQKFANYNAALELAQALEVANTMRRQGRQLIAGIDSTYAGAGVRTGQDTAAYMVDSANEAIEYDASQAILEGARKANQLRAQGTLSRTESDTRAQAIRQDSYANAFQYGYGVVQRGQRAGWFTRQPQASTGPSLSIRDSADQARMRRMNARFSQPSSVGIGNG